MNKRIIILIALTVLATVGAASAGAAVDNVEIRGTVVEANGNGDLREAGSAGPYYSDYTWSPYTFGAFWYDPDDDLSSEMLRIGTRLDDRTITENNLTYTTMPLLQDYAYHRDEGPLGNVGGKQVTDYFIEGWMAEKYVAISTAGSTNANANKIVKLLVEFESSSDMKTLVEGEPWDLGGGFTLTADQLNLDGNKVWLILSKDGTEIYKSVVDADTDSRYMYTEDLSGVKNVVVFYCTVDAVFMGTKSNLVQVKYVFLIDNDVEKIETGTTYGNMEVKTASAARIVLANDADIDLSRNTEIEIIKDMYFKVADDDVVRFYPYKVHTEPDDYNVRGTIVEVINTTCNIIEAGSGDTVGTTNYIWSPYNYAAFWHDPDDDLCSERLSISAPIYGRTIDENNLIYATTPQAQDYEYYADKGPLGTVDGKNVTNYYMEGWMVGKYVAISTGGSTAANANKLTKLLVEFESNDKKTLAEGEPWDLGGGFTLNVTQLDIDNDTVTISLAKNSVTLNETVIDTHGDRRYLYTEDISGVSDVIVFFCYVDAVLLGTEIDLVQLKYIYLIDNDIFQISLSANYGNMEVKTASANRVVLKNDGAIDLSRNTNVEIMDDMYFKVADSDMVRFYPFVERTIDGTIPTPPETIPAADADNDGVPDVWDTDNSTSPGYWTDSVGHGRKWGDMNGDGKLTSVDALMILQATAGTLNDIATDVR